MKSMVDYIKRDKINSILLLVSFVWFVVVMAIFGADFFSRFAVELEEGFREDGPLYFMVGRGIVNGLRPYVDYFETKGPILFYLCALSYLISGPNSYYAINVFSFICIIAVALLPIALITIRFIKQKNKNYLKFATTFFAIFTFSFLLAAMSQHFGGRIHAETFCTFFILIVYFILYLADGKKLKLYSPTVIISGVLLCITALSKETFAFIAVVGILFICRSKRDLIYKFLLPFSYGVVFAFIFLAATNTLVPYFSIYIKQMIETWLPAKDRGYEGIPFILKMLDFPNVINFMWRFSPISTIAIIVEFLLAFYFIYKKIVCVNKTLPVKRILLGLWYCLSLVFITPFFLALGDPLFTHQHAAGIPTYYLILFFLIDNISFTNELSYKPKNYKYYLNISASVVAFMSCLSICLLPKFDYKKVSNQSALTSSKEGGAYVDAVLDALNEERYQYLGNFLNQLYCYTNHLPYGPCFFQIDTMFQTYDSYFAKLFTTNMQTTNVIVCSNINCGKLTNWTINYIETYFTTKLPEPASDIEKPQSIKYVKVYYRIKKQPLSN